MPDTETLRSRLARKPIVVAPGVYDPFTALVATQAGFETLFVRQDVKRWAPIVRQSGESIAN